MAIWLEARPLELGQLGMAGLRVKSELACLPPIKAAL